jgi:tetratricopeptide (TPR) repeat protein
VAGTARRLRRNLRRLYLGGRGAITLLVGLAVATLVIAIVVTLSRDLMGRAIRIDAIQVPKTMAEAGISSEVAARQLRDSMNSVIAAASSGSGPVLQLASDAPDIVVPTVGISFSTLSEFVRSAMGMNRRVISGEITGAAESARMRLRIDGHVFHEMVDADMRADEAWLEAAKAILRQTAPYIVAWALQETDPAAAVAEANRIIARLPPEDENVPWAHLLRAACALDRGMWERARGDIDAALRASHGKSAAAYLYRGRMLIEQARWGDAAAALQSARFFDRTDPAIDHYLALALWGRGDLKGARAWFADSERKMRDEIRREPGNVTTLNSFANSLAVQGRIQEALEMSRWAVDLAPQSGVTRLTLALREQEAGLDRAAIESAREAARLAPASHTILVSAAGLIAAGPSPNLREGLRLLDRATDADPDYVLAYVERARLLKRLGRLWDAEADIARALSLNPATYSAQYEVGTKLAALHQAETADRAFGLACAASLPRHPCLLGWSDALRAAGSVSRADTLQDEALKELDRLTRAFWRPEMWLLAQERERKRGSQPTLGDPPPLPAYLAARCETLTQSDRAAAREHCERAVRLAPKETVYREKLALLLASDGDGVARDRAIGILGEAFAANPDSPSTLIALAKQFEAGGDFEAARA